MPEIGRNVFERDMNRAHGVLGENFLQGISMSVVKFDRVEISRPDIRFPDGEKIRSVTEQDTGNEKQSERDQNRFFNQVYGHLFSRRFFIERLLKILEVNISHLLCFGSFLCSVLLQTYHAYGVL